MGRHSGWIATYAGIAGGATVVLIPEIPFDIDEVCDRITGATQRAGTRRSSSSPRAPSPRPGTLEVADREVSTSSVTSASVASPTSIAGEIGERTGFETRPVLLGHVQRGGTPTAFDRVLSTRFGVAAIDLVHDGGWGQMVALQGDRDRAARRCRGRRSARPAVDMSLFQNVAEIFFA